MAWIVEKKRSDGGTSYKLSWRDPSGRVKSETFRKKKLALDRLHSVEEQKNAGTYRDPALSKVTLRAFWEHFIRTSPPPAPSTEALYRMQARLYILPKLGNVQLRALTNARIKTFLADLKDDGVGEPSINSVHRLLRRILSVAVEEGRIPSNPAARIKVPKGQPKEMRFLDHAQVRALADEVPDRYKCLIYFLAYTGARIGEAAALRVRNVDLMKRQVLVVEASKEVGGHLSMGPTKTKQNRGLTLPRFLAEMLAEHLAEFSNPKDPDALVFSGERGAPIRQSVFRQRVFKPAAFRAKLPPGVRPHDLRHTAVALAIEAGWHAKKIQDMLGHSSIEVTLGTYGHLFETLHEDAADRLDALYRAANEHEEAEVITLKGANSEPAEVG
jgi:integrase